GQFDGETLRRGIGDALRHEQPGIALIVEGARPASGTGILQAEGTLEVAELASDRERGRDEDPGARRGASMPSEVSRHRQRARVQRDTQATNIRPEHDRAPFVLERIVAIRCDAVLLAALVPRGPRL